MFTVTHLHRRPKHIGTSVDGDGKMIRRVAGVLRHTNVQWFGSSSRQRGRPKPGVNGLMLDNRLCEMTVCTGRSAGGQHFLTDSTVLDQISKHAGVRPGDTACEIGGGDGRLTERLAAGVRIEDGSAS